MVIANFVESIKKQFLKIFKFIEMLEHLVNNAINCRLHSILLSIGMREKRDREEYSACLIQRIFLANRMAVAISMSLS